VKNSKNSKKIKCTGESGGPQEERADEKDTKKSSCNPGMGYDAKRKKTQGLGCTKYCCMYHLHINNAKYNMQMPRGIDSIYMGCHILSSVSCINSELIDFCSLSHLIIIARMSTVITFVITFTQVVDVDTSLSLALRSTPCEHP